MTWQQIFVAVALILGTVFTIFKTARASALKLNTPTVTIITLIIDVGFCVLYAWVLHSGGFW